MSQPSQTLSPYQIYPTALASSSSSTTWPSPTPPPSPPPRPTPPPPVPSFSKRRRRRKDSAMAPVAVARQTLADQTAVTQALAQCQDAPYDIVSCFPTSSDNINQHEWASFVWNSQRPELTQTNKVNIYLYRAYSGEIAHSWENVDNNRYQAGMITAQVNDTWWGNAGENWDGKNIDYSFFWAITRSDQPADKFPVVPQATFNAVQTTYADFVASSMSASSASAAAASASAAAASASLSEFSRTETLTSDGVTQTVVIVGGSGAGTATTLATLSTVSSTAGAPARPSGNVQSGEGDADFPHWAIAVIVVLGFLAIVAGGIAAWLIMRRLRQRRANASNRTSTNSGTPILARDNTAGDVNAPLMAEVGMGGAAAGAAAAHKHESGDSKLMSDGASTISRAHSESAPFSGADAAIMADAFRKALRKPEFPAGAPEEGETPDSQKERREAELLGAELAQEGRDLRSVGSSRDVRVQSASAEATRDDHSTIENAP